MSDKFLNKFVKKNYNNQLEQVLSNKDFSIDVKNTLLSIFYKIENGYNDYKIVKRETFEKKEYIEKIISIIKNDIEKIEFIEKNSGKKETVDKTKKQIICYPIEINILYSISKIQKRNIVVKYLDEVIEEGVSCLLNDGNNIDIVEPLRDFNGFSWNIISKDIQDLNCNLLYQNMIFLLGNKFVDKWSNNCDSIIDYFEIFSNEIKNKYGEETQEKIIKLFLQISIELKALNDIEFREKAINKLEEIKIEAVALENKEEFLLQKAKQKKNSEKEIKRIDKILNNKELLIEEYEERNERLPLQQKIFSIRVLKNILREERKELIEKINEYNKMMNPNVFLERKSVIEKKILYMDTLDQISNKDILQKEVEFQKEIIKCMQLELDKCAEKNEVVNIIYKYRYYNYLPITNKKNIMEIKTLEKSRDKLTRNLIEKALKMKIITKISNNDEINYFITKKLLLSKIITLEDINIKPLFENNEIYLVIFDEEIEDTKIKLENTTKEALNIRFNKKTKLFI